jgi:hypothetical protein
VEVETLHIAPYCTAGSPPEDFKTAGQTKEMFMHIALGIAFAMVAVAPFFGRWRANVWLKKNMPARRVVKTHDVPEAA